ncbi:MutS-related protein [Streptomyces sp. CL12]|uniref:MutS-related protein n=1 Tax=Streptomyces sp. CL12 TaxID=3391744 RepID=UPI003A80829F
MKACLLQAEGDPDRDVPLGPEAADLTRDLGLDTLFDAMAQGDGFLRDVARRVVLTSLTDPAAIVYRQRILRDWLRHPDLLRQMFGLVMETIAAERRVWPTFLRSPDSVLRRAVQMMDIFTGQLRALRKIGDEHAAQVESPGLVRFFDMLRTELDDAYLHVMDEHVRRLKFKNGVLVSCGLGQGCKGRDFVLRRPNPRPGWRVRLTAGGPPAYTYRLPDRDEQGSRALAELRDRGLGLAADALARSADHILSFFTTLSLELGFYVCCLNLHQKLTAQGAPSCLPVPLPTGRPALNCRGLYDICLSLRREGRVVGNDVDADGTPLIVVTGANEGGKSTFLRSVGLAQLMMQAGMFVAADSLTADVRTGLFTHYRREEDADMRSGKLDEELARLSDVVGWITPGAMVLFNESFAATNEREGSEIGRQIIRALVESGVKVLLVTHLFDLARSLRERPPAQGTVFLRARRRADGKRTFRLQPGAPLPTSFGEDLYRDVFGEPARPSRPPDEVRAAPGRDPAGDW